MVALMSNFRETPNAEAIPIEVCGSSTFGRYQKIASGLTVNMFISDDWMVNFAGYQKYVQLSENGKGRGIFRSVRRNIIVAVTNSEVWVLSLVDRPIKAGDLATFQGDVFMAENLNNQICIVDGQNAYIISPDLPYSLTTQALTDNLIPTYVKYHNTFFLFGNGDKSPNGAAWYAYEYLDPTHIIKNSQFAIQTKPDYAIAVERLPGQGNNVLVFGSTVCEIFTQVGGIENYVRNKAINIDYGCASVSTIASSDQFIAWLAVNESNAPVIMIFSGQTAIPVSSDGIDYLLGSLKHPEQSTAMFYRIDGHLFYHLTFYHEDDNLTLAYDFITKKFYNLTDEKLNYHSAAEVIYYEKDLYFISLRNACIYKMSTDFTTYNDNLENAAPDIINPDLNYIIPRMRICESVRRPDSSRFIANSFVLTIEQGNDTAVTELSIDQSIVNQTLTYIPRVDLSLSKDSGITWGSIVGKNLQPSGKRKNILTWGNMGVANDLTIKLQFWGSSRFVVNNAVLEIY